MFYWVAILLSIGIKSIAIINRYHVHAISVTMQKYCKYCISLQLMVCLSMIFMIVYWFQQTLVRSVRLNPSPVPPPPRLRARRSRASAAARRVSPPLLSQPSPHSKGVGRDVSGSRAARQLLLKTSAVEVVKECCDSKKAFWTQARKLCSLWIK